MNNIIKAGQIVALLSFISGTTILALFLYLGDNYIDIGFAVGFVLITLMLNTILFTILLVSALIIKQHRKECLLTCGIMLLNIPVALLYLYMVVSFPNVTIL